MKTTLQQILDRLLKVLVPEWRFAWALASRSHPAASGGLPAVFNTGGPRSRVVRCPVVSPLLEEGSAQLGIRPALEFAVPVRGWPESLRRFVRQALADLGFGTPEEAWDAMRDELPSRRMLTRVHRGARSIVGRYEPREIVRNALVLGRCSGRGFSPERPIIWSDRRLERRVWLVDIDGETFTAGDDHD